MTDHEFKFYYPRLIESFRYGKMFTTRQHYTKNGTFGYTVDNRIYVFGLDTFERKTTVALNHEIIHTVLDNVIGRRASFTFDFIFEDEVLPVIRKLLGRKLGFALGVYQ